jgi:Na+-translocating ferredoxin:NAD+ oxidoreductase subunit D
MTEEKQVQADAPAAVPTLHVASSPHVANKARSTHRMMTDVLIALIPVVIVAVVVFRQYAVFQMVLAVSGCLLTEYLFAAARKKAFSLKDCSAVVTGIILAMSLPWSTPWFVTLIAGVMAIALGKMIFGGLGQNLFNPAMVGRAFVMICFASAMGASAYRDMDHKLGEGFLTQATPMTMQQQVDKGEIAVSELPSLWDLFLGKCGGSLGEISALACLVGGLYLLVRRTAAWEIPAGVFGAVIVICLIMNVFGSSINLMHQLLGGALMFGAFFIATDPVSSPLTLKGRMIFGVGVGAMVMCIRLLSNYPEGVMFAVLLMNAVVPLINRATVPTPLGGLVPEKK